MRSIPGFVTAWLDTLTDAQVKELIEFVESTPPGVLYDELTAWVDWARPHIAKQMADEASVAPPAPDSPVPDPEEDLDLAEDVTSEDEKS